MKKLLLTLLLVAAAVMPASAGIFKFGVEGGLNLNKMDVNNTFDSENQAGWFIGPKVQATVPLIGIMVDASLQYSQQKMSVEDVETFGSPTIKKTLPYVVLPINLKYGVGLGSLASVYFSTGPQINWYVGDKSLQNAWAEFDFASNTVYWNFGVGVHLMKHLQVGATYNLSLGKSFAEVKRQGLGSSTALLNNDNWKNNGWQVRIAYMF